MKENFMDEIIEVENYVDANGIRFLHLMSNEDIDVDDFENPAWLIPDGVDVNCSKEAGAYHLRATWRARQSFFGMMRGSDRHEKQMALWALESGDRISVGVHEATVLFRKAFGRNPNFAAVRTYPRDLDVFCEIDIGGGRSVSLLESADVPDKFVMVF